MRLRHHCFRNVVWIANPRRARQGRQQGLHPPHHYHHHLLPFYASLRFLLFPPPSYFSLSGGVANSRPLKTIDNSLSIYQQRVTPDRPGAARRGAAGRGAAGRGAGWGGAVLHRARRPSTSDGSYTAHPFSSFLFFFVVAGVRRAARRRTVGGEGLLGLARGKHYSLVRWRGARGAAERDHGRSASRRRGADCCCPSAVPLRANFLCDAPTQTRRP